MLEDDDMLPKEIVVSDHTGTFTDYTSNLMVFAEAYAHPIHRRLGAFPNHREVIDSYLNAFQQRFLHLQQDYHLRKRAFETLFKHRPRDERGSLAYRWERILERLNHTHAEALTEAIRKQFPSL